MARVPPHVFWPVGIPHTAYYSHLHGLVGNKILRASRSGTSYLQSHFDIMDYMRFRDIG